MHEWIPVTKELPDDDRYVLVTADDVRIPFNARHVEEHGREMWLDEEDYELDNIIAWMELPERYEEGKVMASVEAMVTVDDGTVVPKSMVMRWIPINEQVPEHNQLCLVTVEQLLGFDDIDRSASIGRYRLNHFDIAANDGMFPEDKFHRVTAWIPVPEAYEGEQ